MFQRIGADGNVEDVRVSSLFAEGKDTLFLYGYMFGPEMKAPCPSCTCFLDAFDGTVPHLQQTINVGVVVKSPIDRVEAVARDRGWQNLPLLSSHGTTFQRDYLAENDAGGQMPMANVFVRQDGVTRHFWGSEMLYSPMNGGHPRHIDMMWPVWNVLDTTPGGRDRGWMPELEY